VCRCGWQTAGRFSGGIRLRVLCNVRVQVNLTISSIRLQFYSDYWLVSFDLLLDCDCPAVVGEVVGFKSEGFADAQSRRSQQYVQNTLLLRILDDLASLRHKNDVSHLCDYQRAGLRLLR